MEIIFKEINNIYLELLEDNKKYINVESNKFPELFYIYQYEEIDYEKFHIDWQSSIIQNWKMKNKSIVEDTSNLINFLNIDGMFYFIGNFRFSIDFKTNICFIEFQIGPRYGRGFEYRLEKQNNSFILIDKKVRWIS